MTNHNKTKSALEPNTNEASAPKTQETLPDLSYAINLLSHQANGSSEYFDNFQLAHDGWRALDCDEIKDARRSCERAIKILERAQQGGEKK